LRVLAAKLIIMNQLIEIVLHPAKYRHIANLPMQFDAAEQLVNSHWEELKTPIKKAIARILIHSGRYTA
jgi:hypothetical protein